MHTNLMISGDSHLVSTLICILLTYAAAQVDYRTPPAQLEIVDDTVRVSIPDFPGIESVAFNINRNREFANYREGEFSQRVNRPTNGTWSVLVKRKFYDNDLLYVWTGVQHYGRIYQQHTPPVRVGVLRRGSACEPAQTITTFGGNNYCIDQLLFEEKFTNPLNGSKWTAEVRHCLYTANEEFVVFNNERTNLYINNTQLHIVPTIVPGDLKVGHIDLGSKCTSHNRAECEVKTDAPYKVLPPVQSALLNTKDLFNFKYGRVKIKAKLPKGDWLFPYVVLRPVASYDQSEIRIAFIRGNEELKDNLNNDVGGRRLYGGTQIWDHANECKTNFKETTNAQHFGDGFHTYEITWKPNAIIVAVDDKIYGEITESLESFQQPFYIAIGVSVGGHTEFESIPNKPWKDSSSKAALKFYKTRDEWSCSWKDGAEALIVDYVQVYAA